MLSEGSLPGSPPLKECETGPWWQFNVPSLVHTWLVVGRAEGELSTGLASEEQFNSTTLLWVSWPRHHAVGQQVCVHNVTHMSFPFQFEGATVESVNEAYGLSIQLRVVAKW